MGQNLTKSEAVFTLDNELQFIDYLVEMDSPLLRACQTTGEINKLEFKGNLQEALALGQLYEQFKQTKQPEDRLVIPRGWNEKGAYLDFLTAQKIDKVTFNRDTYSTGYKIKIDIDKKGAYDLGYAYCKHVQNFQVVYGTNTQKVKNFLIANAITYTTVWRNNEEWINFNLAPFEAYELGQSIQAYLNDVSRETLNINTTASPEEGDKNIMIENGEVKQEIIKAALMAILLTGANASENDFKTAIKLFILIHNKQL